MPARFVIQSIFDDRVYTRAEIAAVLRISDEAMDEVTRSPGFPAPLRPSPKMPPLWRGIQLACWMVNLCGERPANEHVIPDRPAPADATPLPPPPARPNKASGPCAKAVLCVLYQARRRLSTAQVEDALVRLPGDRQGEGWSTSAVEATLAWLVSLGLAEHCRSGERRGYALAVPGVIPTWEGEPVCASMPG